MNRSRKATGCWWVVLVFAILGAIVFGMLAAVPYINLKTWVDGLASDGDIELYTHQVHQVIRTAAIPFAIVFISLLVYLTALRRQSNSRISTFRSWTKEYLSSRWQEIGELFYAIKPTKQEYVPLLVLLGIVAFGIFFRYAYLWRQMGHDETYTFMAFASRGLRVVVTDYHLPNNHIFHTILVNLFYQLFGDSPAVIRLTAFIAGILIIPATYMVGRIFYEWKISLLAASIVAALPVMIDYSTTARGYTIITLFALLIIALAAYVKDHPNQIAWLSLVLISSLGLYTNPTMIYPVGMTFTWLILSSLVKDTDPDYGKKFYIYLLFSILGIIIMTGILYIPIFFVTGLQSVIGNEVVETLSWSDFSQSLLPRINNTWAEWNRALAPILSTIAIVGLIASFFVPRLPNNRRVPLIMAGFLWIATALVVQRVAPWPRIWLFLLPFFIIWITAGIVGLFSFVINKLPKSKFWMTTIISLLIIAPLAAGLIRTYPQYSEKLKSQGEVEQVADFLQDHLQEGDVVVVTSPDTVVLKYYMRRNNLANDFTDLVKGKQVSRSIVVVNQAHNQTLEYVLERRSYLDDVQLISAEEIYRSRRFILYQLSDN